MTQAYKQASFPETRLTFGRIWVQGPRHSENDLAEMCYLYRRTHRGHRRRRVSGWVSAGVGGILR